MPHKAGWSNVIATRYERRRGRSAVLGPLPGCGVLSSRTPFSQSVGSDVGRPVSRRTAPPLWGRYTYELVAGSYV